MEITREELQQLEQACGPDTIAFIMLAPGGYHIGCRSADGLRKVQKNVDHNKMLDSQQRGTWPEDWAKFCRILAKTYRK